MKVIAYKSKQFRPNELATIEGLRTDGKKLYWLIRYRDGSKRLEEVSDKFKVILCGGLK